MAFEALKEKQSVAWSSAPYEQVSVQHLGVLDDLLDRLDPQPGLRLLDVATGTGELARPAARRGLRVTGIDFAESLIATARSITERGCLDVEYDVGDAEVALLARRLRRRDLDVRGDVRAGPPRCRGRTGAGSPRPAVS